MKKLLFVLLIFILVGAGYLVVRDMRALDPAGLAYVKSLLWFGGWVVVGILCLCVVFLYDDKEGTLPFLAFLGLLLIVAWRLT